MSQRSQWWLFFNSSGYLIWRLYFKVYQFSRWFSKVFTLRFGDIFAIKKELLFCSLMDSGVIKDQYWTIISRDQENDPQRAIFLRVKQKSRREWSRRDVVVLCVGGFIILRYCAVLQRNTMPSIFGENAKEFICFFCRRNIFGANVGGATWNFENFRKI